MYTIITDSCCDLNEQVIAKYSQLEILNLSYTIAGVTSTESLTGHAAKAYYDRLRAGEVGTTSQITPAGFLDVFRAHAARGEAMLCLVFSSALSGTYGSACVARDMLLEEQPDAQLEVVDTLSASAGQGMVVVDALERRDAGMSLAENAAWIRAHIQQYVHWFTVDDLHFLKRGGRCSPSAAFFGSMLNIKPVLHVDKEGKLIPMEKVRGRRQALKALAEKLGRHGASKDQTIFISHGDCEADAQVLAGMLVDMYGCDPEKIVLSYVGPVIGSHSGPGTVALFFRAEDRG